ncbi:MAG TPA: oligosaccharide flippase family protein [Bacteroidia bacterium]|jgi:O-antigen/teichoic acid export membrane protein|nr:oligosaccharide flippase family protein [Bacteroidia bacterium]
MSDQGAISKNITHTFIVQIPNYILGIIAGIFLTRQLGPEGKGDYTLFLNNVQLLVMLLGVNLPGAIQYFLAGKKMPPERLAGISLCLLLISSVVVFTFLFLIPSLGNNLLKEGYETFFFRAYIFASFVLTFFNAMITGFLQGHYRFREVNKISVLNSVLNFVIFTTMYFAVKSNIVTAGMKEVLGLTVLILSLNCAGLFYFLRKTVDLKKPAAFTLNELKPLVSFLIPAFASVLINFFNSRLNIWLVEYYAGTENLGYFSLALNFAQLMLMVTLAINTVLFPYFAATYDWDTAIKNFSFALKINMAIMALGTISLIVLAPFLIPFVYGKIFSPSILPVQLIAVGTFFCSQSQVFGHFLGARNKNWVNTFIYGAALLCLAVSGLILVPFYSIEGAAIAGSISYFVMFTIFCVFMKVKHKVSLLSLFIITKADILRAKNILFRVIKKN